MSKNDKIKEANAILDRLEFIFDSWFLQLKELKDASN